MVNICQEQLSAPFEHLLRNISPILNNISNCRNENELCIFVLVLLWIKSRFQKIKSFYKTYHIEYSAFCKFKGDDFEIYERVVTII